MLLFKIKRYAYISFANAPALKRRGEGWLNYPTYHLHVCRGLD